MSSKSLYFGPRHDDLVTIWPLNRFGLPMAEVHLSRVFLDFESFEIFGVQDFRFRDFVVDL
jgi:hypothetical protein